MGSSIETLVGVVIETAQIRLVHNSRIMELQRRQQQQQLSQTRSELRGESLAQKSPFCSPPSTGEKQFRLLSDDQLDRSTTASE